MTTSTLHTFSYNSVICSLAPRASSETMLERELQFIPSCQFPENLAVISKLEFPTSNFSSNKKKYVQKNRFDKGDEDGDGYGTTIAKKTSAQKQIYC
jgi:hypothetical protein